MAERCALFIIIALGEGIVVSAAAWPRRAGAVDAVAMILAFAGSALMWWIYFGLGPNGAPGGFRAMPRPGAWRGKAIPICTCRSWAASYHRRGRCPVAARAARPGHDAADRHAERGLLVFLAAPGCSSAGRARTATFRSHWIGGVLLVAIAAWGALAHPPAALLVGASVVALTVVAWREWASARSRASVIAGVSARVKRTGQPHVAHGCPFPRLAIGAKAS
jgi:hypothetical protein